MRWKLFIACLPVLVSLGCRMGDESPAASVKTSESRQIRELREQVETLQAENAILISKLEELSRRNKQLAKKVNDLKFTKDQNAKLIATLAEVPKERDRYKAQVEKLALENAELKEKVDDLAALARSLAGGRNNATTQPGETDEPATTEKSK